MRLLQSASAFDSLLESGKFDAVGLAYKLLCPEKVDEVADGKGVMKGGGNCPGGPENGLPLEGTDNRRPVGAAPPHETGLDAEDTGDCMVEPN